MGNPALTDIDGIGPATAKKLQAAGFGTVAELAAAETEKLETLEGMPPGAKFADWIAAAKTLQGDTPAVPEKKREPAPKAPKAKEQPAAKPVAKAAKSAPAKEIAAGPIIVVTGPKKGFRRAGYRFDKQPRAIPGAEFGDGIDGLRRVLAILNEDRLTVVCSGPDGVEHTPDGDAVAELTALAAAGGEQEVDPAHLHDLVERIFGAV